MPILVIVGGQFGGEGKGLVSAAITNRENIDILVKAGGPNASHSFFFKNTSYTFRMFPSGTIFHPSHIVFPPGCLIYPPRFFEELKKFGYSGEILVDPQAGIITEEHLRIQENDSFYSYAGSTLTGTGAASAERVRRRLKLAKDFRVFDKYLSDTQLFIFNSYKENKRILIEGSQGFGLSNYHGTYPFVSSRDCTANGLLSQIGFGSSFSHTVIMVIKCFPTRNKMGAGNLPYELSSSFIQEHKFYLAEYGGGGYNNINLQRRVGLFDFKLFEKALIGNSPHQIALTGLDKLDHLIKIPKIRNHYGSIESFISKIERLSNLGIMIRSNGPNLRNVNFI